MKVMDATWKANVLLLLDEAYTQAEYKQTWIKDNEPNSSLIPAFDQLSAEEASGDTGIGRNPPAGHAHHLAVSLEAAARAFRGGPYEVDWEASWRYPQPLTEEAWADLRVRLAAAYADLRSIIAANDDWEDPIRSLSVLALLAHAAYHLGSVRQITVSLDQAV